MEGWIYGTCLVALSIQLATVDIGSLGLDAEHVLCVLLVGDGPNGRASEAF